MKTAAAVAESAGGELTAPERESAGGAVHYGFAAAAGAAWGALAACAGLRGAALGALYGAAVWYGANAAVLPALGLSKAPRRYAPRVEAASLAGHLAWGAATELVRRAIAGRGRLRS